MQDFIVQIWKWAKANDIPNWIVLLFTAVFWPLVLFYFNRRKVSQIPHLEVKLSPGQIEISGQPHDAVTIDVINHTQSVVYLSGARLRKCSSLFTVPIDAARDIAADSHHLAFIDNKERFNERYNSTFVRSLCRQTKSQRPASRSLLHSQSNSIDTVRIGCESSFEFQDFSYSNTQPW